MMTVSSSCISSSSSIYWWWWWWWRLVVVVLSPSLVVVIVVVVYWWWRWWRSTIHCDGCQANVSVAWSSILGSTAVVVGVIDVNDGSHNIYHTDPTVVFSAIATGDAQYSSYAFPVGSRLARINTVCCFLSLYELSTLYVAFCRCMSHQHCTFLFVAVWVISTVRFCLSLYESSALYVSVCRCMSYVRVVETVCCCL